MRSGVVIDREAFSPPVLELLLLAEDIGLLNGTADLLVSILDDNDNWPTFSPPTLTVHLLENCPAGKQGTGPRQELLGGAWRLEPHRLEAEFTYSGKGGGGRGCGENPGERVRKTKTPTLLCSDPWCLAVK